MSKPGVSVGANFDSEPLDLVKSGPSAKISKDASTSGPNPNELLGLNQSEDDPKEDVLQDMNHFLNTGVMPAEKEEPSEKVSVEPEQQEEPEVEAESADEEVVQEEAPVKESRSEKRIRELNKRYKETSEQLELQRQQFELERQQWQFQQQQAMQESQRTMQQYFESQQRSEMERKERARYEEMTPVEQLKYDTEKRAYEIAKNMASQEAKQVRAELAALRAEQAQKEAEANKKQRFSEWTNDTLTGRKMLLSGIDEKVAKEIHADFDEMIMGHAAGFGIVPSKSAKRLKAALDKYVDARVAAKNQEAVAKVKAKQGPMAKAGPGAKAAPTAVKPAGYRTPSLTELQEAGFDGTLHWISAGRPMDSKGKPFLRPV